MPPSQQGSGERERERERERETDGGEKEPSSFQEPPSALVYHRRPFSAAIILRRGGKGKGRNFGNYAKKLLVALRSLVGSRDVFIKSPSTTKTMTGEISSSFQGGKGPPKKKSKS